MVGSASSDNKVIPASSLRIAMFSDAMPDRNGVGTYYRDLSVHLRGRVDQVELFCPEQDSAGKWRDPISLPLPGDATQTVCIPNYRKLSNRFRALEPHAVVLSTPGPYGFMGLRLARKAGTQITVGFHTNLERLTELYWQNSPTFGKISKWYLESGHRRLFRHATAVLTNSQEMIPIAKKIGAKNLDVMGTTIAPAFLNTPITEPTEEFKTVVFAGRLAAEKNLEAFIAAAEALPELEFHIAGDGPLQADVTEAAARLANLKYQGWMPRSEMPALIDASDLLVLPSHVESFGTIALEAMARNRCVLVSQNCGIAHWSRLHDGLFRIQNKECVADAVRRVWQLDPAMRLQTAKAARQAASELNEWTVLHWLKVLSTFKESDSDDV